MNRKAYILLLEEDALLHPLVVRWLGEAGYDVATQALIDSGPALVIADVPDPRSAEALVRSLREYAAPILLVSARFRSGLARSMDAARRLGVRKVLPKPFSRQELLDAVREAVEE